MSIPTEIIQQVREAALEVFKRRAERNQLIVTVCGWCNAYIGEQPGRGVSGISHGCCETCFESVKATVKA